MGYVGRFAPSPTGPLHLGSLVAALGSFLDARAHRGRWLLRIEDLDTARIRPRYTDDIKRTLEALDLQWDGTIAYQSSRQPLYAAALTELRRQGRLFACGCTRRDRADAGGSTENGCQGSCRSQRLTGPSAARFAISKTESVSFVDRLQGSCSCVLEMPADIVVQRRDQVIAYQLAVVVDDAEQAVTDVVRGADLLASTPWQILLQRALGLAMPRYAHVPVVVEADGAKLAKSRRSVPVDPRAGGRPLVEALTLLRQMPPPELVTAPARNVLSWALEHWNPVSLERVQKATASVMTP
ncbi:MAG TPA: tRNA glutamyl-Q(34) synthetase GluQRS [Steroidobacteraceae bacterium]